MATILTTGTLKFALSCDPSAKRTLSFRHASIAMGRAPLQQLLVARLPAGIGSTRGCGHVGNGEEVVHIKVEGHAIRSSVCKKGGNSARAPMRSSA